MNTVVIVTLTVIVITSIIFTTHESATKDELKIRIGPQGDVGPPGPIGDCNLTAVNGTFLADVLEIISYVLFEQNATIIFHEDNSIVFLDINNTNTEAFISYNSSNGCVEIEPKICTNMIQGGLELNLFNITGDFIQMIQNLLINSIVFNNQSYISIIELVPGNASTLVLQIGGVLPVSIPNISLPFYLGGCSFTTGVSSQDLIINCPSSIQLLTNIIYASNLDVDLNNTLILGDVYYQNSLNFLNNSYGVLFYDGSYLNEEASSCSNSSTVLNAIFCLVLRAVNQITLEAPVVVFDSNVTIDGFITDPLFLDEYLFFKNNYTSISNQGDCLTLTATQICLVATTNFNFSTPVTFNLPIQGVANFSGNVIVQGSLTILGSFNVVNFTVSNTLSTNNLIVNQTTFKSATTLASGAQLVLSSGSSMAALAGSNILLSPSTIVFNSANSSAISCTYSYFDVASGCIPKCTNHSTCTDTFSALTISSTLNVLGDIYASSNLNPHPCCTGMSETNFMFFSYQGTQGTLYNTSSANDDDWMEVSLNFTSNNYPSLGNPLLYLPYFGGSNITFNNSGVYTINVEAQIDKATSAKQIMFLMYCTGVSEVFTSSVFRGINGFNFGGSSIQKVAYVWKSRFTAGSSCTLRLAFSNGRLTISSGRTHTIGIFIDNVIF